MVARTACKTGRPHMERKVCGRGVTRSSTLRVREVGGLAYGLSPQGRTTFVESVVSTPRSQIGRKGRQRG
jgi:hypothetical protein